MGKKSNGFLVGTFIGGLVGAATALFLAPKTGKELRQDLNQQASLVKEKTDQWKSSEIVDMVKEKTTAFTKNVSDQSSHLFNRKENNKVETDENEMISVAEGIILEAGKEPGKHKVDIQKILEETENAFTEAENRMKQ